MKILVINADCIRINSSANLCHLAYIKGLVDSGHDVTLLHADPGMNEIDPNMQIPDSVKTYSYHATSFYETLSILKKKRNAAGGSEKTVAQQPSVSSSNQSSSGSMRKVKDFIISLYGPHGIYVPFVKKAKRFRSDIDFDFVISLSSPTASHLLAYKLIKSNRINAKEWIQIWEDPWYTCFHDLNKTQKIYKEEARLLAYGQKICYVSPLTLNNQLKAFPQFAEKMYWQPLPHYYKNAEEEKKDFSENYYGYFGDYDPQTRNLEPFYLAAKKMNVNVNICGNPNNLFDSTDNIHIHPRLKLDDLKKIEDKTNVLIFLANRIGGQIPGKIYQYSATYKTVLFILDGTNEEQDVLKRFFQPFNRHVFCHNNVDSICEAIKKIESNDLSNVKNVPLNDFDPIITIENILKGEIKTI